MSSTTSSSGRGLRSVQMRILAVNHGPTVRSELFGDVIRDDGHELVEWELPAQGVPSENGFDAFLVFGGRMNIGEEDRYPWLLDEYGLLRSWVAEEKPLLTVCLGAQALAHATGGTVGRSPRWNAGFYDVTLTSEGEADPILGALPERFEAFLANAYEFQPGPAATRLASTSNQQQAFRVGERAWGVQFHPEARKEQVLQWWSDGRKLERPLPVLSAELDEKMPAWHELGRRLCRAFLREASK